ncbi:hypothetical protein ACFQHO_21595 [Actinomadura yumaensis]|uniref:hypothetical protein n=1 Tax=Actinomadura yumaensis TaxID=111807 RepID=UPI00362026AE
MAVRGVRAALRLGGGPFAAVRGGGAGCCCVSVDEEGAGRAVERGAGGWALPSPANSGSGVRGTPRRALARSAGVSSGAWSPAPRQRHTIASIAWEMPACTCRGP